MKKIFIALSFFVSLVASGTNYTWDTATTDVVINNTIFGTLHAGDTVFIPARTGGYASHSYDRLNSGADYSSLANGTGYIVVYWQAGSYITPTEDDEYSCFMDNCYGLKIYGLTMKHCANMPWRLGNSLYGPDQGIPHGYSSWICIDSAKFIASISIENVVTGSLAPFAGDTNNMYHHWWIRNCIFDSCYTGAGGTVAQRAFNSGKVTTDGYWRDLEISGCVFDHYQPGPIGPSTYINAINTWGAKIHNNIFRNMGVVAHPLGHASLINMDIGGQLYIYNNVFGPDNFANDFRLRGASLQLPGYTNRNRFYNNIIFDKRKYPVIEDQEVSSVYLSILSPYVIARSGPEVFNNTIHDLAIGVDNDPYIVAFYDSYTNDTVTVKNNVFTQVRDTSWATSLPRIIAVSFQTPSFWDTAANKLFEYWADAGIQDSVLYKPVNGGTLHNAGAAVPDWLTVDHYGSARTSGSSPDIGAVELIEAGNQAPVANAGSNQTIQLPVSTVSLSGSGADVDGTVVFYAWTQISGTAANIVSPSTPVTAITGLTTVGVRVFRLTVTDNAGATGTSDVTITVTAANIPPVANAGSNQTIQLPVSTVTLTGIGTDADGTIATYAWSQVNGTAATITTPSSSTTTITGLTTAGVRVFRLTVTDNQGAIGTSDVTITVTAANIPPVANAGPNQTIQLPISTVTLTGSGIDADGTIVSYGWTKIAGPTQFNIVSPSQPQTIINNLVQGTYQFRLTVTDNQGDIGTSDVTITVTAANIPPVANAGPNQTIQLPVSTVTLTGSGFDADGTIATYIWSQVNGTAATITTPSSSSSTITGLTTVGVRVFRLTVTDNQGAIGTSDVTITVTAANIPPVANAGSNQTIQLPISIVTLNGSGSDADGTITTYSWSQVNGTAATITTPTSSTTTITGLTIVGVRVFRLTVTDNQGAIGTSDVTITVTAANIPPVANAGPNQTIQLPISIVTLNGSGSDADGTITTYSWSQVNGTAATITTPSSSTTTITGLTIVGVRVFRLTVTDNQGAIGTSDVTITVIAANIPPVANAGSNQTIQLPVSTVTLTGSGTDADGTIATYNWSQVNGTAAIITTPTSSTTTITGLTTVGVRVFRLTVTDNQGAIGTSDVTITVTAANISPVANAGSNQTIQLPISTVTLTGSGSDADGTIVSYGWTKIAGPTQFNIVSPSQPQTIINNLVQGTYQFELTVTDNQGAIGTSDVTITVTAANIPPVANAGSNQTIQLPISTVTLTGSGTDADGTIATYNWSQLSGTTATITTPSSSTTTITGLTTAGVRVFRLTVTDNQGAIGTSDVTITVTTANIPPVANAGPDQTIQLPVSTVTLTGSGSDADGTIATYNWSQLSGTAATITTPTSSTTTITGLTTVGVRVFRLTVTDNQGAIGTSDVTITVTAANIPPVANAGPDQTIQLPVSSVALSGSGTDADGTITTYNWSQLSGTAATITTPTSSTTTITGLTIVGVRVFRLTVTDNQGAIGTSDVTITVIAANIPPVANAGSNQTIQLPVSTVTLTGSGTDADGTIATYTWSQVSGTTATITTTSSASTTITGLTTAGVRVFRLTVTDNQGAIGTSDVTITVAAANIPPVANAGPDQTIQLPVSTVTLTGSGTDADGTIATYNWSQVSGTSATITTPTSSTTTITGLTTVGVIVFRLTVTDNQGAIGTSDVTITVTAANIPPVANAGPNQTIQLPTSTITLTGSGTDADGTIVSYGWTKIAGPTQFNIVSPSQSQTIINNLVQGTYQFELTVTDNQGAIGTSDVTITVTAANIPPVANAGPNQTIQLPVSTVTLTGSGTDADGTIATYNWSQLSGTAATITAISSATTTITGLTIVGVRVFRLTVTDNQGAIGTSDVTITVTGSNIPPVANAGPNQTIQLPISTVTLTGSGTDADGTIVSYGWTKIAGPTQFNIVSPSQPQTIINNLVQGTYQFRLIVTDNQGAIGTSDVAITVTAANIPPVANAGPNQTIQLPVSTVTLTGSGTDADGTIATYNWSQLSGTAATITTISSATTTITGLTTAGVRVFRLTVTDNQGAIGTSDVTITVTAANIPPVANAGTNQTIQLPVSTVTLSGSGTDADGTIVSYSWTKIAGPTQFNIVSPSQSQTIINNLVQGTYQFRLTVTDNQGAIGTSDVTITVTAANIPPVANAGANQTIQLPVSTVTLTGSGTDADGTIVSYGWTKIAGPTQFNIVSPSQSQTIINNLVQGIYQFRLTVTDNQGATGTSDVTITVTAANIPPVANAGANQTIQLPASTVTLAGSGTDADGTIVSYGWTKIAGPTQFNIVSPSQPQTIINNLVQGTYQFRLTVTDNQGAIGTSDVTITVTAANIPPVANAGSNQTIQLPVSTVTLTGSGTDADGTIVSYGWTKIAGPTQFNIVSPSQPQTIINNLVQGTYQFRLTVTDNQGAIGTSDVTITVIAANIPPVANAGPNQTIQLPVSTVTLTGSGTDADGTIVSYGWTKIAGPTQFNIVSPSQPQTIINTLVQGTYQFRLTVTDNQGAIGTSDVTITVIAANIPPVANAGSNQTIQLPISTVVLTGSGTDADGTIATYNWSQVSGTAATITAISSASTTITGLTTVGVRVFRLTVTDNQGATGTSDVTITVIAANIPPVANAGTDQTIQLPVSSVALSGSGTDADGTIVSYGWTKIAGPTQFNIVTPSQPQTIINNLVQGTYQFELTVTDNQGAIGKDTIIINVGQLINTLSVKVFPNPAETIISIGIDAIADLNKTSIDIYDSKGKLIYQEEFIRNQISTVKIIDVSKLSQGLYLIRIGINEKNYKTLKLVKQ